SATAAPAAKAKRPAEDAALIYGAGPNSPGPAGPEPDDAVLAVRDLSVAFDGPGGAVTVGDPVSFTLRAGEVLGIVGESGCGKSVTALSLLQLLPPNGKISGGRVLLGGQDL